MKIRSIALKRFKRFTDLTVRGIPDTAKLIVLAGPNGSGKSSFLEALHAWHRQNWKGTGLNWDAEYYVKQQENQGGTNLAEAVRLEFYDPQPADEEARRKAIYVRSAYRNDPDFQVGSLNRTQPMLLENRFSKLIDNDAAVSLNYSRLAAQGLEDVYEKEDPRTTIGQFREKAIGEIRDAFGRLFPGLVLNSLGNPLTTGTFRFDKGSSKGFLYKNLSGGEKAAFDLLLDLIVKKREFDDTVFCIDEPEAHMNPRLQGALLDELFGLLPPQSQLWVATNAIGMMRRARDLSSAHRGEVVFFDFEERDFDQPQILEPVSPTRRFWERSLRTALDDFAELVAPQQVVICEGKPLGARARNVSADANCYNQVFVSEFPDTLFISTGNATDVEEDRLALVEAIKSLARGVRVIRLIDRDDRSAEEIAELRGRGVKVLGRRHLESYMFDDDVLAALCQKYGQPAEAKNLIAEKMDAVQESVARGNPNDDVKSAAGQIYNAAKRRLNLRQAGNDAGAFMQATLAPLVTSNLPVYQVLRSDIFG